MKKALLTCVAALFLATGAVQAAEAPFPGFPGFLGPHLFMT
jgi:hypothetical protein